MTDLQQTERSPSRLSRRIESYQSCASRRDGELVVESVLMRLKNNYCKKKKKGKEKKRQHQRAAGNKRRNSSIGTISKQTSAYRNLTKLLEIKPLSRIADRRVHGRRNGSPCRGFHICSGAATCFIQQMH